MLSNDEGKMRTALCGELRAEDEGKEVVLVGFFSSTSGTARAFARSGSTMPPIAPTSGTNTSSK